jgi:hypothetical protein
MCSEVILGECMDAAANYNASKYADVQPHTSAEMIAGKVKQALVDEFKAREHSSLERDFRVDVRKLRKLLRDQLGGAQTSQDPLLRQYRYQQIALELGRLISRGLAPYVAQKKNADSADILAIYTQVVDSALERMLGDETLVQMISYREFVEGLRSK